MDIDFLIDSSPENEAKVFQSLESLPDQAVNELDPGDVERYKVVRVADEIVVDLMHSAGTVGYEEAKAETVIRQVGGVAIPFASPRLLWRMKARTRRAKDSQDIEFLRAYFASRGEELPRI